MAAAVPGGQAGTLVFSHANGFPAGTYRLLFEIWRAAGWRVLAVERYGHDERWPVSSNWPHLRDELLAFIAAQAPGEKVHLVGHSLGGYLSLLAACKRPEIAAGLVLLDSPLLGGWRAHSLHAMKLSRLLPRITPGRVSVRRRRQWPSAAAAHAHFASKSAFARWQHEVLADYIACGLEPDPEGGSPDAVRLAFSREVETRIYNTLPHHLDGLMRRHPPGCRAAFIGGTRSTELHRAGLATTRALVGERLSWIEGSHLFPMEKPGAAAAAVLHWLTP
ncbi:Alpha/beta hydrolase [Rubrivivax sp. A210]|uniref:alpha/beta hydrolase n=1 Tax=Rubrivivax sp. A210 TaxID=2772301 RepID=UPI00191855DF|nr:alpha/beta hydrolase [Rubrivivax sp. A210]CAD5374549.1 Alpha/beta hydrolase [Rubrivivax sp. A210]